MITAPKKTSNFEPVPKGTHVARLYQIVHIGTSHYEYMGEEKSSDKVRLTFELCNERKVFKEGDEPKPYSISREFGLSMGKKSHLRPFVEGMAGTAFTDDEAYAFDIETLIGSACLLNVVHAEKGDNTYANISSATPLVKGMEAPEQFNESKVIDVNSSPEEEIAALPDFLKDKIYKSDEWALRQRAKGSLAEQNRPSFIKSKVAGEDVNPDDIPF
jgi:hypothetical protein